MPHDAAVADAIVRPNVPTVDATPGRLADAVREAADALHVSGAEIYTRGGTLVRPVRLDAATEAEGVKRAPSALILKQVDPSWLTLRLAQAARWHKADARATGKRRAIDPPRPVADAILSSADELGFRPLRAVVPHPVIMPDGRVIDAPGYDAATRLLLDFDASAFPPVVRPTTKECAIEALAELEHLLRHYRFATPADRAVALSLLVTPLVRPALDTAPMHLIDAPTPGSGKTLLVAAGATLATGAAPAVIAYGQDEAETEKRLTGAVKAGDALILLDNIARPLQGEFLNMSLTAPVVRIRPLGTTEQMTVPMVATICATGNNVVVRGDLTRRVVSCRIDPGVERPEARAFDQDLLAEVRDRRGELVRACLTIVAAFIDDGSPDVGLAPLGSFDGWSRMVRSALVYAGAHDPVATTERTRESDPTDATRRAVFAAWRVAFGRVPTTAAQAIKAATTNAELREALTDAAPGKDGTIDAHRLGNWLKAQRDRVAGNVKLVNASPDTKSRVKWIAVKP